MKKFFRGIGITVALASFFAASIVEAKSSSSSSRSSSSSSRSSSSSSKGSSWGSSSRSASKPSVVPAAKAAPAKTSSWGSSKPSTPAPVASPRISNNVKAAAGGAVIGAAAATAAGSEKPKNTPSSVVKTSPLQAKLDKSITSKQSLDAYKSYKAETAKFKATPVAVASAPQQKAAITNKIASSGVSQKTYFSRRNDYYRERNNYQPPTYVYNSPSSFGMWDTVFLYMMLDNINDRNTANTYYHHQDDPGIKAWRAEAERQAATNAELKTKLAALDAKTSESVAAGLKKDDSYIPVDKDGNPAPVLAEAAVVSDLPAPAKGMGWGSIFFITFLLAVLLGVGYGFYASKSSSKKVQYI